MARTSKIALAAGGAALAAVLAACGNAPDPGTSPAPPPSSAAPTSAPPSNSAPPSSSPTTNPDGLCTAKDLKLALGRGDGTAGTVYRPLLFTNVSDHGCTIQGFPGVSYVAGADGHQVGAAAFRDGSKRPAIRLGKGETASAEIGFVNVGNYDEATCEQGTGPRPARLPAARKGRAVPRRAGHRVRQRQDPRQPAHRPHAPEGRRRVAKAEVSPSPARAAARRRSRSGARPRARR